MSDENTEASKAVAQIVQRMQQGGEVDWLATIRIWVGIHEPKLLDVIERFIQDAAVNNAAAAVIMMMSAAFESGRAHQLASLFSQSVGRGISVPAAVPPVTRLPAEGVTIKLESPATFEQADMERFAAAGGKIDKNGHRIYVIQPSTAPSPT